MALLASDRAIVDHHRYRARQGQRPALLEAWAIALRAETGIPTE